MHGLHCIADSLHSYICGVEIIRQLIKAFKPIKEVVKGRETVRQQVLCGSGEKCCRIWTDTKGLQPCTNPVNYPAHIVRLTSLNMDKIQLELSLWQQRERERRNGGCVTVRFGINKIETMGGSYETVPNHFCHTLFCAVNICVCVSVFWGLEELTMDYINNIFFFLYTWSKVHMPIKDIRNPC